MSDKNRKTRGKDFIHVPHALIESLNTGRCGLFVGSGLSINADLPSWEQLIREMISTCVDCGLPENQKEELDSLIKQGVLLEAADFCREKMGNRRYHDLMQSLFRNPTVETTKIHKLLPIFEFPLVLTTNYDKLIEEAFSQTNKGTIPPVYTYRNTASLGRLLGESSFFILKIHGDIDDVESIILTKRDYRNAIIENPACRATLFNLFASYSFLFIGFGIRDPDLNLILEDVSSTFGGFARRHFALMPNPGDVRVQTFSNSYNIEIISYHSSLQPEYATTLFFENLRKSDKTSSSPPKSLLQKQIKPTHPYKFLDYFEIKDSGLFFGRDREVNKLLELIGSRDVTVLTGRSGVGKTSLIKAGIQSRLDTLNIQGLYVRCSSDMLGAFDSVIPRDTLDCFSDSRSCTSPNDILDAIHKLGSQKTRLLIVFDQFEEFYVRLDKESRKPWIDMIASIFRDQSLLVKYLFTLREDFLVELNEFSPIIPGIFNNLYRLENLSKEGARLAICKPAEQFDITYEPNVLEDLIDELFRDGVEPAHLQIVCSSLFDTLTPGDKTITKSHYESLGGARDIIQRHISRVLDTLRSQDKEIALTILKQLVTNVRTKALVTFDEIIKGFSMNEHDNE